MLDAQQKHEDPAAILKRVRKRALRGSTLLLDSLTDDELAAAKSLIFSGEAEIVSAACKPFIVAKLDRIILS